MGLSNPAAVFFIFVVLMTAIFGRLSCGLTVAYYAQRWLGSFQAFLGAAWGCVLVC